MANYGKIKKNGIASLIKNDICKCRMEDAEHPELASKNSVTVFYQGDGGKIIASKVKDWDDYSEVNQCVQARIKDRLQGCKAPMRRGDIVGAVSLIVHRPPQVPEQDTEKFFAGVLQFVADRHGAKNLLMAARHYHEHTPHTQIYFMPMVFDEKLGRDKLSAYELMRRPVYQTLHDDLQAYMDRHMGYHIEILLDDDTNRKRRQSQSVNTLKIRTLRGELRAARKALRAAERRGDVAAQELAKYIGWLKEIRRQGVDINKAKGSPVPAEEVERLINTSLKQFVTSQNTSERREHKRG